MPKKAPKKQKIHLSFRCFLVFKLDVGINQMYHFCFDAVQSFSAVGVQHLA